MNINASIPIGIPNREIQIAAVIPSISHITPAQDGGATKSEAILTSPMLLREGFESGWRARNISSFVGDNLGTLGNGVMGVAYTYNGGTRNPADVAQNVPGAVYNTESVFTWQNNGANRPPSPNPPIPLNYGFNVSSAGGPLTSAGFGGADTGISAAGLAQAGTRIAIRFTNIPPSGSVTVPASVQLTQLGQTTGATGVMALTSTDTAGAGPYTPRSGTFTATDNLAVYEVLFAVPYMREDVNIPFTLSGFPDGVQLRGIVSLAPFYSTSDSESASAALPEPRFLDPCGKLPCLTVFPASGRAGDMVNAAIAVNPILSDEFAAQILNGAQVKLTKSGLPDIPGIPTSVSGRVATRDLVVTPTVGTPTVLPGGFNITAALPCSYTVGPMNLSIAAAGGPGTLVVSPVPADCSWSATTGDSWITLGAKQGQLQPYTIAENHSISIAGKSVSVVQQGACTYQVAFDPANRTIPAAGGTISVSITAPAGCAWSTLLTSQNFMHPTTPTSGSGNGVVTISVDPNTGGSRYEYLSIPGSTTSAQILQVSGLCGTDVSTQVLVTRGAILSNFGSTRYTQQLTIKNTSAAPLANVYLALDSLGPSQVTAPPLSTSTCTGPLYAVPNMAPGQSVTMNFQFAPGKSAGGQPPTSYVTRLLTF